MVKKIEFWEPEFEDDSHVIPESIKKMNPDELDKESDRLMEELKEELATGKYDY